MGVINLTFKRGVYIIGTHEITVQDQDCKELGNYHKFIHMYKKPHPMYELEIQNTTESVLLYLSEDYAKNHILFLVFYVSSCNLEMPLIVEIWTSDHSGRRYSYSNMVEKSNSYINSLPVLRGNLSKELDEELYKISGSLRFIVDKAEDYKDVTVKMEATTDEDFIKITHSPQCQFKSSSLTCSSHCKFVDYLETDYNSKVLNELVVYFYVYDKMYKVPLLVELKAKEKENQMYMEYWEFDGMEHLRKKYSVPPRSNFSIINDVKAVYDSYESEINALIHGKDQKEEELPEKTETGSTEPSNELCKSELSLKNGSKSHNDKKEKSKVGFVGIIVLVTLTFLIIGFLIGISTYQYYKRYKGY